MSNAYGREEIHLAGSRTQVRAETQRRGEGGRERERQRERMYKAGWREKGTE